MSQKQVSNDGSQSIMQQYMKHNTEISVIRLPPEVLSEIFKLAIANWALAARGDHEGNTPPYAWILLTHVCHHWREVALQTRTLWTNVTVTRNSDCVKAMFNRSGKAPLIVHTPYYSSYYLRRAYGLIFPEIHRIASLDLRVNESTRYPMSSRFAEKLHRLVLRSTPEEYMQPVRASPVDKLVIPGLKHLELHQYFLPWTHKLLQHSTLTHLVISTGCPTPNLGVETPALVTVLRTLKGLPLLESLGLSNLLPHPSAPSTLTARQDIVHLKHLRTLTLEGTMMQCNQLIQHLTFPTTTQMNVVCGKYYHPTHIPVLASVIGQRLSGSKDTVDEPQTLRCASITGSDATLRFTAWSTAHSIEKVVDDPDSMPPHNISINIANPHTIFTHLCASLPLNDVRTFYLNPEDDIAPPKYLWPKALRNMPLIRELGIGEWASEGQPFPDVLAACIPEQGGPEIQGQHVAIGVLPALEAILFKGTYFYANGGVDDMESHYSEMVDVRHRLGCPIKRILLREPHVVNEDQMDWVAGLILTGEFDWDEDDWVQVNKEMATNAMLADDFGSGDFDPFDNGIFDGPEWDEIRRQREEDGDNDYEDW